MRKQILAKVSPWLLAAACTLLALIIGVFAVNNYQREKQLKTEALLQQGVTIARFVAASTRTSLRGGLRSIRMTMWQWTDHVQQAIDNSIDQPGVRFLGLVDGEGRILASSDDEKNGATIDSSTREFIDRLKNAPGIGGKYRFHQRTEGSEQIFQVVTLYHPFGHRNFIFRHFGRDIDIPQRNGRFRNQGGLSSSEIFEQLKDLHSKEFTLVVELDLADYNKAIRGQLLQILSLSLVLLLVGVGGWLSLLTLQGLKGSQQRLQQIRDYTDILVASLPVGLIATGNDRKIRIFNTSAEDILGKSAEHVIGKDPEEVLPIELSAELHHKNSAADGIKQKEILLPQNSLQSRNLMTIGLPVMDTKKRFAGHTLLLQDISHIKELEKEVRRNERMAALGKMAAGVAHELRNPLSSIKGLALLMKTRGADDTKAKETAAVLVQEVERLNRSIGELLDYARPHKLEMKVVDIHEVIDKAVSLISMDIEAAGIELAVEGQSGNYVKGDQDKLNQVFLNLLLNSLQAMDVGGEMKITTACVGKEIVSTIEDNGCGVEEANLSKVFDPYFTTKKGGTGLGLAMSAKIVEEHYGNIEFMSRIDQGTTVRVTIPAYLEES